MTMSPCGGLQSRRAGSGRVPARAGVPVIFSSHQLELVERICDRVGIVRGGRLVASGTVPELQHGSPVSLVIDAPAASERWADDLPGVSVVGRQGSRTFVRLADGADDQQVLRAALDTGPVREFAQRLPSLADLFRDVVAGDVRADAPSSAP